MLTIPRPGARGTATGHGPILGRPPSRRRILPGNWITSSGAVANPPYGRRIPLILTIVVAVELTPTILPDPLRTCGGLHILGPSENIYDAGWRIPRSPRRNNIYSKDSHHE
jgi:hypothetical protein